MAGQDELLPTWQFAADALSGGTLKPNTNEAISPPEIRSEPISPQGRRLRECCVKETPVFLMFDHPRVRWRGLKVLEVKIQVCYS